MAESPEQPGGAAPDAKKKWYLVGASVLVGGFLTAAGTWAFSLVSTAVDEAAESRTVPFNAQLAEATGACEAFVIEESLVDQVPVDANGDIDEEWITNNGGLQTTPRFLELTLVGADESVVINDISITDIEHHPVPFEATVIGECPPIGGETSAHILTLDYETRTTRLTDGQGKEVTVTVGGGATPEVIAIITPAVSEDTPLCYCTWRLEIAWTSATREGVVTADLDGQPVSLVASGSGNGHYHWFAEDGALRWNGDGLPM